MSTAIVRRARLILHGAGLDPDKVAHAERVAQFVRLFGGDEVQEAAALLHDLEEETGTAVSGMPGQVLELVHHLTNVYEPAAYPALNRRERKALEHDRLARAPLAARRIKLADRLDNLMRIDEKADASRGFADLYRRESGDLLERLGDEPALVDIMREFEGLIL